MAEPKKRWYIIQTYSGQEPYVKQDLERRIENENMRDLVFDVVVPTEKYIEKTKDGKEKEKIRQIYPGYVFVEMVVTDESWFMVRNTPRVTGFLGSSGGGTKPVPLLDEEIKPILMKAGLITKPRYDHLIGKEIEITSGSFTGQVARVTVVDNDQEKVVADVELFGRATPVELSVSDFKIKE